MTGFQDNPVLSVYASSRGFAFVLFEGPESPYDWGVKEIKGQDKNVQTRDAIKRLVDRYRPEVLVLTDMSEGNSRQTSRIRKLHRMIKHLAATEYVDLCQFPKSAVKAYFLNR